MSSPRCGPAARAVGLATAIVAVAALLLGLMAGALGSDTAVASAAPGTAPPAAAGSAAPPAALTRPPGGAPGQYVVVEGDTRLIANRTGAPVELIAQDSGIGDPDRLAGGQALTVSTPPRNVVVVVRGSSLGDYARELSTTVENLLALNPQISDPDVVRAGAGLRIAAQ